MTTTVTKNPKNVEKGKKTYESHMKKIKEDILASSKSTPSSGDLTPLTTTSSTTTPSFTISSTLLGTGAVAVIIVAGYFYINRKKPVPTKPAEQAQPKKNAAFSHMQ